MERTKLLLQIVNRLAELETYREAVKDYQQTVDQVDLEMTALRLKYQDVMNSVCPLIKDC